MQPASATSSSAKKDFPHALNEYRLWGNSGLRVSPICLGTMTFGDKWTSFMKSANKEEAHKIIDTYVTSGGNFIDTANKYQEGQTEEWLGEYIAKKGIRDELVLASKYSLKLEQGHKLEINFGGNSRKSMFSAIEGSLKRLGTHYLDVYYVHFWDFATPTHEILRTFDDLTRSGKVHYVAVSDTPAWEVAYAKAQSEFHGWSQFIGYQGRFHLGDRTMERDVLPMAKKLGLAVAPWGVLGQGKYTGKYKKGETVDKSRPSIDMSDRDYEIADVVSAIATETGRSASQVALNWVLGTPGITSPILGTTRVDQLQDSIKALEFSLTPEQRARLDKVTATDPGFPHNFIGTHYTNNPWLKSSGKLWTPDENIPSGGK